MKFLPIIRGLSLVLFLVFLVTLSLAQEATIVGTITDPSGAAVPNVKISLTNTDTGIVTTVTSSTDGQYVAPGLHIGHYMVRAAATGFKVAEEKGITLQVGDRTRVDFKLQVGNVQETVTVEANAAVVQTDTGEISTVVTGQQISEIAVNGGSIFSLEALTPGASSIQQDFILPTSSSGDFNVSFDGQRVSHNLWLIDGGEAADRGGGGGSIVLPSEDAIAEFRTLTSNYSAEYGLSSAGTVSMVIKSGTSKFHATAFYFGRNDALDARNYFNPAPNKVTELRFNDWGFNVGGPVALHESGNHKTFFFYNMEWRRFVQGGLFTPVVPLASIYPDANGAGTGVVLPSTIANGNALEVVQPANIAALATAGNCTNFTPNPGAAFPNNTIPDCLVTPNASALLGAGIFPKPTDVATWQFVGGGNQPIVGKEEIARIDHQFTDKFSIFGHWISDQSLQTFGTTMWSGDNMPSVGNTYGNPSYSAVVHATYQIRPNLLNEISFNYDGNRIHILPQGVYAAPSGFTFNKIFTGANVDNRIPDIQLGGSTGSHFQVNWLPWNNSADDYQIRDDVSWVRGAHQLKFGGSFPIYKKVQDYFAETQGGFGFNGSATVPAGTCPANTQCGFDYADFILGDAQSYNENAYKGAGHWNAISPDLYFQDNWRATHRLTLNLGLRWDGIPHTYEANKEQGDFYPNLYNFSNAPVWANSADTQIASTSPGLGTSPVAPLQGYSLYLNGIGIGGQNGSPKGLANNAWNNWGPRFGFAYDLRGNGKTVIRGGYGVMYERIQGNDMYDGATNPPFGYSFGTNDVLFSNPHTTWTGSTITVPIVPGSVTGPNINYPPPRVSQYSAGVQQSVGTKAVLSVSYVGSVDRHLSYFNEINLPPAADLAALQGGTSPTPWNGLVPYQGFTSIKTAFNGGNSHYNSLQMEVRGQVTRDLNLQAAYTLSKAIDPTTGNGGNGWDLDSVTNPYEGWRYDVGPSVLDRRNVFFANFVYDIPFLKNSSNHFLKTAVGGWVLSGIITAESGAPYNLGVSGQSVASIFPGGDASNRPNVSGSVSYPKTHVACSSGKGCNLQWLSPGAFSAPAAGTWGNLGFDAITGPGRDNWNVSLFKNFVISESRGSAFQFRAEAFNVWNHTQFGGSGQNGAFSNSFGSGNFGQITNAFDPRVFQLGAKLIF